MYTMQKTLITLVLLVFTAAFATAPMADNSSRAAPSKFVGTFYGEAGRVTTIHSDGTVSLVFSDMFNGAPDTGLADRRTTPLLGVWRKVDANKIQVTTLSFTTELFGDNYNPDGFILQAKWLSIYDDPVQGVSPSYNSVNVVAEVFFPDQNPITDDPIAVLAQPDARAHRLTAE